MDYLPARIFLSYDLGMHALSYSRLHTLSCFNEANVKSPHLTCFPGRLIITIFHTFVWKITEKQKTRRTKFRDPRYSTCASGKTRTFRAGKFLYFRCFEKTFFVIFFSLVIFSFERAPSVLGGNEFFHWFDYQFDRICLLISGKWRNNILFWGPKPWSILHGVCRKNL